MAALHEEIDPAPEIKSITAEQEKYVNALMEGWSKTIDVQQHFNQLCLTIRSLAITVLGAGLGAIPFLTKENFAMAIFGNPISSSTIIFLLLVLVWAAFYLFDRWWYHRFLGAAGIHAGKLEKQIRLFVPAWGLSTDIKEASNLSIGKLLLGSERRLDVFYGFLWLLLLLGLVASLNENFITVKKSPESKTLINKTDSLLRRRDSLLLIELDRKLPQRTHSQPE